MNAAAMTALRNDDLENLLVAITPGGIEAQEAQGQRDFVNASKLPKDGTLKNRAQWESLGVVFGEEADDLFVYVTLPAGWKLEATEHAMHNDLLDEKGRKRAGIFYKAAFYDRSAHVSLCRRFSFGTQPVGGWQNENEKRFEGVVRDGEQVIFTTEPTSAQPPFNRDDNSAMSAFYAEKDARQEEARVWLAEHYPDHENVLAYWND